MTRYAILIESRNGQRRDTGHIIRARSPERARSAAISYGIVSASEHVILVEVAE